VYPAAQSLLTLSSSKNQLTNQVGIKSSDFKTMYCCLYFTKLFQYKTSKSQETLYRFHLNQITKITQSRETLRSRRLYQIISIYLILEKYNSSQTYMPKLGCKVWFYQFYILVAGQFNRFLKRYRFLTDLKNFTKNNKYKLNSKTWKLTIYFTLSALLSWLDLSS